MGSAKSGGARVQTIRRWLDGLESRVALVSIEAIRGDRPEPLASVVWDRERKAESMEVAGRLDRVLQDQANLLAQVITGRMAAYDSEHAIVASMGCRALPNEEAELLPDGQFDGSVGGQLAQLQKLVEHLVRMSLEERIQQYKGWERLQAANTAMIDVLLGRHAIESTRADTLREAVLDADDYSELAAILKPIADQVPQLMVAATSALKARKAERAKAQEEQQTEVVTDPPPNAVDAKGDE